jgi:hypothetical protein
MRRMLLGGLVVTILSGCWVRYPLNCPPYDPAQYGCGPRDPYFVMREYKGPIWANPGSRPYYVVPPYAPMWYAPPAPPQVCVSPRVPVNPAYQPGAAGEAIAPLAMAH